MKLTLLFLLLPFAGFCATSPTKSSKSLLKPESVKFGKHVKTVSSLLSNKANLSTDGTASYHLKVSTFNTGNAAMNDAFVSSEGGIIQSLSLVFDKTNGEKFRNDLINQYGMPDAEMTDNFEWKTQNVVFEIHETSTGYTATYQNVRSEQPLAQF